MKGFIRFLDCYIACYVIGFRSPGRTDCRRGSCSVPAQETSSELPRSKTLLAARRSAQFRLARRWKIRRRLCSAPGSGRITVRLPCVAVGYAQQVVGYIPLAAQGAAGRAVGPARTNAVPGVSVPGAIKSVYVGFRCCMQPA